MNVVEIRISRKKFFFIVALTAFNLIAYIYFFMNYIVVESIEGYYPLIYVLFGFAVMMYLFLKRALDKSVQVVISTYGITNKIQWSQSLPWDQIKSWRINVNDQGQTIISFEVDHPEIYFKEKGHGVLAKFENALSFLNREIVLSKANVPHALQINTVGLELKPDAIEKLILEHLPRLEPDRVR